VHEAIYNSAIPAAIFNVASNTMNRASRWAFVRRAPFFFVLLAFTVLNLRMPVLAEDWHIPEQQLARKIVAVTGPGTVALTVENRSSLGQREVDIIQDGLRSELEALGLRFVKAEQAAATVSISLSENVTSYVWVASIRQAASDSAIVMVSAPRVGGSAVMHDSVPMVLHRTLLWSQDAPILDVAVLEESTTPTQIAVLDSEKVSVYRLQAGKWQQEQLLPITHTRPWPRDLRGRLVPGKGHLLDVYLPGVWCQSTTTASIALNCRESEDPWPVGAPGISQNAFFSPTRNFFTGALTPGVGKFTTVPKFYAAAPVPREKYVLWLFAATDGRTHLIDGLSDQTSAFHWGHGLVSMKTTCGSGWQVLASADGNQTQDSVRAYEFPDRDPVAVSAAVDFPGTISELWPEAKGDTAIAIVKNSDTGNYEAFRLAVACSQ
jgi:hypothetical protein